MGRQDWGRIPITRRRFIAVCGAVAAAALAGCRSERGDEIVKGIRTFVDDAGREHSIPTPENLKSVYFTSALAQLFVMTLKPEVMGATCSRFTQEDMKYLPNMKGLEYLGAVETGQMDVEAVMQAGIQVIFSVSSIELVEANIDEADNIQKLSGIPVILIDGSTERISEAYRKMGDVLGCKARAAELAKYCEQAVARVTEAVSDVSEGERVSVYYAEGPKGLQTEPASSQHAWSFVTAGGRVVAEVDWFDATGMSDVSLESVIGWDPDVIVTWDAEVRGGAEDIIRTSPDWAVVKAVRNGRVYAMPNVPVAWVDRPMACNRFLGVQWLANMFYPDRYDVDMVEVGKEYYKLFFGVDVTDDEMQGFLGASYPPYRE
ncbi:MAG TPA: ABC transporter substrate-binding protein [Eggerthellaceae bacterium]|nr:ABC transporter substrate-binding protein [Eggerthellaceae bacterium]